MNAGTLVRFWENGFRTEVASAWVDWKDGWFHLDPDRDLPLIGKASEGALTRSLLLTVYSTKELLWAIESVRTSMPWSYSTIHCVPWVEQVRHNLISDDYMVYLWLEAERRYQESLI